LVLCAIEIALNVGLVEANGHAAIGTMRGAIDI
jgi:hypothetical protein